MEITGETNLKRALLGKKLGGRLEEWVISTPGYELGRTDQYASGEIFNDERSEYRFDFQDGSWISTTRLLEIDLDEMYIITANTLYTLGKKKEEPKQNNEDTTDE